ncbi:hypothetical protein [Clostridium baratii]|uniref:Uncharacterized protein n=1 Tax=Clostridium baratii TaxID=1561 RepID=A0A174VF11_9CLOT|nr:hypothetical protein [Clostridium baratii]CUQ30570.1 Uncharacterised protein [Clostridium baratii]
MKEKKIYLIKLLKNFDEKLDGDLEFQYRNKECSTKEFLQNLINKEIPFWLENNSNDLDWTILLKGFNECFKELLKDLKTTTFDDGLFNIGTTFMTVGIRNAILQRKITEKYLAEIIKLHLLNKSDSCKEDINYNFDDIKNNEGRVLNRYKNKFKDIFIITDIGKENKTTIMFVNEY